MALIEVEDRGMAGALTTMLNERQTLGGNWWF